MPKSTDIVSLIEVRLLHYLLPHYEPTYFNEFFSFEAHSPEGLKEKRKKSWGKSQGMCSC
jgi:hypothetical protein